MRVRDFMSSDVVSVSPETPVKDIWHLIFKKHVHGLPVVDKRKKLVGIISEVDFLSRLFPGFGSLNESVGSIEDDTEIKEKLDELKNWKAEQVMNRRVFFTRPDTHIMRALSRMMVRRVRLLPVLDDDDKVIGVITKGDIFAKLMKLRLRT